MTAVVAAGYIGTLVEGKAHVTAVTFLDPSAIRALHRSGISAAVMEQYGLTTALKRLPYGVSKLRREYTFHVFPTPQISSIHNLNLRQLHAAEPLCQCYQSVLSANSV